MKKTNRIRKHKTIRRTIVGTKDRPRLSVYRSGQHIYVQIIDDSKGVTLLSGADYKETGPKLQKAYNVGKNVAKSAAKVKITSVVFDRGGFLYKGRIAELAKGVREGGLKF